MVITRVADEGKSDSGQQARRDGYSARSVFVGKEQIVGKRNHMFVGREQIVRLEKDESNRRRTSGRRSAQTTAVL